MRIAFVPSAPLLLPQLGGGPADLRTACLRAISVLGDDVVVLGAGSPTGWRTGVVDATPFGAPGEPAGDALPLPLAVGTSLLGDRPHRLLAVDGSPVELGGSDLLVVGDGTARRTEKAPGHLDARAAGVDAAVSRALVDGDPSGLAIDPDLADELLVSGAAAWRTVAGSLTRGFIGEVLYDDAPYGVGYLVATWLGS